jgi:hypothetical protein
MVTLAPRRAHQVQGRSPFFPESDAPDSVQINCFAGRAAADENLFTTQGALFLEVGFQYLNDIIPALPSGRSR